MSATKRAWLVPLLGIVLVLVAVWMLAANERTAAAWHRGMSRPDGDVLVLAANATPDKALQGRQVLVSGVPQVAKPPHDRDFHVWADTPLLVRKVAMFQWHELDAGAQVSYQLDWIDHPVDSSRFRHPAGHANTQAFPFTGQRFQAPQVRLGHFTLAPAIVHALPGPLQLLQPDFSHLPANLQASFQVRAGTLTTSADPQRPRLGDLRVRWLVRPLERVTVVARVDGARLVPAPGPGQGFDVQVGTQSLTDMFPALPLPLRAVWAWRAGALVLAWIGAWLLLLQWWRPRGALPLALAGSAALLALVAGIVWVATSWVVAVIAWAIAVLAALGSWQARRRVA